MGRFNCEKVTKSDRLFCSRCYRMEATFSCVLNGKLMEVTSRISMLELAKKPSLV